MWSKLAGTAILAAFLAGTAVIASAQTRPTTGAEGVRTNQGAGSSGPNLGVNDGPTGAASLSGTGASYGNRAGDNTLGASGSARDTGATASGTGTGPGGAGRR